MDVIVVASSEPGIQETLRVLLGAEHVLVSATTLPELMNVLVEHPVDIIILDEFLDNVDGASVCRQMRSLSKDATCIMLAVQPNSETVREMRTAGVYDIVSKPFDTNELLASVARALERSRLMTKLAAAEIERPSASIAPDPNAANGNESSIVYRREMLDSLRKFLKATTGSLEPQRLYEFMLETVAEMFSINRAVLLLHDEGTQHLRIGASIGLSKRRLSGYGAATWQEIVTWFRKHDQILDLDSPDARMHLAEAIGAKKELALLQSRLCLPLMADGRLIGALTVGKKMTGRRLSEPEIELLCMLSQQIAMMIENAKLHRDVFVQKEKFEGILQGVNSGLFATDSEGQLIVLNTAAEQILDIEASQVLGKSVQRIGSVFADIVFRSLQEEKSLFRHEVVDPATKTLLGISTSLLTDAAGKPIGVVALFTDLSTVSRADAGSTDEVWQRCALRLAHEIKNPLVAIRTFAQLFPESYEDEKFRDEFGEIAIKEIDKLDRVVERLLRFAQPLAPRSQPDDIHALLDEEIQKMGAAAKSQDITVEKSFRFVNGNISFDRELMGEALEQIISNALEAMPSGGTISISTNSAVCPDPKGSSSGNGVPPGNIAEIQITDTGVGIAPEELPNLFKPFHTGKLKGMGLGLPISRRIIMEHSGNITVSSELNKGTTVKIVLPYGATNDG
jgi:nitrogen-specific signal transduction histidine kinase/DNA-binding response OmpR family regulator